MWRDALDSCSVLLLHPLIPLASPTTNILISTLNRPYIYTFIHLIVLQAELLNEDVSHIISLETAEADEKEKREKEKQNIMCGPAWKSELGRAVRFSGKIAKKMTMEPVQEVGEGGAEEGENQKGGKMNLNKSEDKSEKFGVRNRRTSLVSAARTTNLKMPEHVKPSLSKAKSTGPDNEDDEEEVCKPLSIVNM